MQYTFLGRSGLQVSRFCLGTMNFGMVADERASFSILDQALHAGINFIDTADVYGGQQSPDMEKGYGISEEIIGRWLAQDGRRERIVLATKVYQPMGNGPNDRRLSAYHIRKAAKTAFAGCRPITSTSTKCTTSIGRPLGKRSGRQWSCWYSKAR